MTVTERERRRMELVDGGANRTELCEQLAMREYELDFQIRDNWRLTSENEELRELLQDSLLDMSAYAAKYGLEPTWDTLLAHEQERMRKLGIEVNG